ncbi:hypothetical protein HPB50_016538 [Hyalomma asiaticum]|uniref:Uncharacterized protein n=1 Tax=Hyalomma asiaticum TaxID=266040 RepID=A0ACB7T2T5_HYAAI|nr:hypothetical protein HPB50_016538 [Hyalomma asiaticum]
MAAYEKRTGPEEWEDPVQQGRGKQRRSCHSSFPAPLPSSETDESFLGGALDADAPLAAPECCGDGTRKKKNEMRWHPRARRVDGPQKKLESACLVSR